MSRPRLAVLAILLVALFVVGCGGDDSSTTTSTTTTESSEPAPSFEEVAAEAFADTEDSLTASVRFEISVPPYLPSPHTFESTASTSPTAIVLDGVYSGEGAPFEFGFAGDQSATYLELNDTWFDLEEGLEPEDTAATELPESEELLTLLEQYGVSFGEGVSAEGRYTYPVEIDAPALLAAAAEEEGETLTPEEIEIGSAVIDEAISGSVSFNAADSTLAGFALSVDANSEHLQQLAGLPEADPEIAEVEALSADLSFSFSEWGVAPQPELPPVPASDLGSEQELSAEIAKIPFFGAMFALGASGSPTA